MNNPPITENLARQIYAILVRCVGARNTEDAIRDFVFHTANPNPTTEYRFQGLLGFGGKFWTQNWRVNCYSEDTTPRRQATIDACNAELAALAKACGFEVRQ